MGEASRKKAVVHSLVVGKNYGDDLGIYRGHGTGVLVDPDSSIGGTFKYYVFEQEGGRRKRLQYGEVIARLKKIDTSTNPEPPQQAPI